MKGRTMNENKVVATLADVLGLLDQAGLTATRHRDMVSAVKRVCAMAGTTPAGVRRGAAPLRGMLSRIRPAAHGISAKSYSNLEKPSGRRPPACRRYRPPGPGRRQT